jgi:hypothetical protein
MIFGISMHRRIQTIVIQCASDVAVVGLFVLSELLRANGRKPASILGDLSSDDVK